MVSCFTYICLFFPVAWTETSRAFFTMKNFLAQNAISPHVSWGYSSSSALSVFQMRSLNFQDPCSWVFRTAHCLNQQRDFCLMMLLCQASGQLCGSVACLSVPRVLRPTELCLFLYLYHNEVCSPKTPSKKKLFCFSSVSLSPKVHCSLGLFMLWHLNWRSPMPTNKVWWLQLSIPSHPGIARH